MVSNKMHELRVYNDEGYIQSFYDMADVMEWADERPEGEVLRVYALIGVIDDREETHLRVVRD